MSVRWLELGGMIARPSGMITYGSYGATGLDSAAAVGGTKGMIAGLSGINTFWGNGTHGSKTGICARYCLYLEG